MLVIFAATPEAAPPARGTLLPIAVIGGLALLTWLLWLRQRRKLEHGARSLAEQHGWEYHDRVQTLERGRTTSSTLRDILGPRWLTKDPMGRGFSRRATQVVSGTHNGVPFTVFSYRYTEIYFTGRRVRYNVKDFHIGLAPLPAPLPTLEWAPKGIVSQARLATTGLRDLQFESPDFNQAWHVTSADPRFAYAVFTPQYLEWITGQDAVPFLFRLDGSRAIAVHTGLASKDYIVPVVAILTGTVARIPRHVWQTYGNMDIAHGTQSATNAEGLQ